MKPWKKTVHKFLPLRFPPKCYVFTSATLNWLRFCCLPLTSEGSKQARSPKKSRVQKSQHLCAVCYADQNIYISERHSNASSLVVTLCYFPNKYARTHTNSHRRAHTTNTIQLRKLESFEVLFTGSWLHSKAAFLSEVIRSVSLPDN